MNPLTLSRLHGIFNLASGLWPLLHNSSFEAIFGHKTDRWLVKTVAGLLIVNGCTQLAATGDPASLKHARIVGIGTAATLATIDVVYAPQGRIRRTYLIDAAAEIGWILMWQRTPLSR